MKLRSNLNWTTFSGLATESMMPFIPEKILIQRESLQDEVTLEVLKLLPGVERKTVEASDLRRLEHAGECPIPRGEKKALILIRYPGSFLKSCQGSGADMCCNYYTLNCIWNCHLECTYCVLQSYLSGSAIVVCTNFSDLEKEVRDTLAQSPGRVFRIGTGELGDSLALDALTGFSRRLVPLFADLKNGYLELKTKSDCVSNLEGLEHRGHTIVSWSMNAERICRDEESRASTLRKRLAAAAKCRDWGYRLGFHFDPIVYYEGWESGYRESVRSIFRSVEPASVAWISLGALRFPPHLIGEVKKRFPDSGIPYGEFVPGHHGKLRYFRPLREEMYRKMISWICEEAPQVLVYLCMESGPVWERSFNETGCTASRLCSRLDDAAAGPRVR